MLVRELMQIGINEELNRADEMQKEFINIAAHELRTPIQPILGLSEVLHDKIKDTKQIQLVDTIIRNAKRKGATFYFTLPTINIQQEVKMVDQ